MNRYSIGDVFDTSPDGILITDGTSLCYQNPAAVQLLAACGLRLSDGDPMPDVFLSTLEHPFPQGFCAVGTGFLSLQSRSFPVPPGLLFTLRPMQMTGLSAEQLSLIARQLRSPLSTSMMVMDFLEEGNSVKQQSYLAALRRSQYRLLRTVTELQLISDLSLGGDTFPRQTLDLAGLLDQVIREVEGFLHDLPIQITAQLPPSLLISGHSHLLRHLLLSLLSNAISAQASQLTLSLQCRGEQAILTLRDNGHGIRSEALSHAFYPLLSESSLTPSLSSGLALCRQIVRHHQGTLLLHNDEDGAICTVSLPLSPPERLPDCITFRSERQDCPYGDLFVELSDALPDSCYTTNNLGDF